MNQTPAGWYTDPGNPQLQRYWDGSQWTNSTAPAAGQAQAAPVAQPSAAPAPQLLNPYDKNFNIAQLSEQQRAAYAQHTLTEFPTWAVVVLSILTLGGFGTIYHGLKHSKLPRVRPDDFGAGKGIGFLFIPFFNLYWAFVFWLRLVDRINFQYRLRGAPDPVSRGLALWTLILAISSLILGVTLIVSWITALIVAAQIQAATNRLVKGEVRPRAASAPPALSQASPPAAQPQPGSGSEQPPPPPPSGT